MCLLVFSFGFSTCPLLVCSNRDEYLSRPTVRGKYHDDIFTYAPQDVEAGGTWIAFSEVNARFVIVLNYHQWRSLDSLYSYLFPSSNRLSRGTLAMNFITSDPTISARDYAYGIFPGGYAGFNLLVGDKWGCYYVSNAVTSPRALEPRRFYGISNGHLDAWEKSTVCRHRVESLVMPYLTVDMNEAAASRVATELLRIMRCAEPLSDPTFGLWWPMYTIASAIFVDIEKNTANDFCTRTTSIAVAYRDDNAGRRLLIMENDLAADTLKWSLQKHSIKFDSAE